MTSGMASNPEEVSNVGLHMGTTQILTSEATAVARIHHPTNTSAVVSQGTGARGCRSQGPRPGSHHLWSRQYNRSHYPVQDASEKPEHIMKNYQVILFPGSKEHSAPSPGTRAPAAIPSPATERSLFSLPQAPGMHTLRFVIQAFYTHSCRDSNVKPYFT